MEQKIENDTASTSSSSSSSINDKEVEALEKFRTMVKDIVPDELVRDDTFLRRWLIARDFNLNTAFDMLKKCMEWRFNSKIDKLIEWNPPNDLRHVCPYHIIPNVDSGQPLLVFPWGSWRPWEFTDTGRRQEYLDYMYQLLEKCITAIQMPANSFLIIADASGFSIRHMTHLKAIETNLEVLRGFEARYPEYMHQTIVINCPKAFSLLFRIFSPLMSHRTKEKLKIFDHNSAEWKKCLTNLIPPEVLPKKYGGQRQLPHQ